MRRKRNVGKKGSYLVGKEFVRRKRNGPLSRTQPLDIQKFPLSAGKTSRTKNGSRSDSAIGDGRVALRDDGVLALS